MGKHRAVKRLGALLAAPVVLVAVPIAIFLATNTASATVSAPVPGAQACINNGAQRTIEWSVSDDTDGELTASSPTTGAGVNPAGPVTIVANTPLTITMTLPGAFTGEARLDVSVTYLGDPVPPPTTNFGTTSVAAACPVPPIAPGTPTTSNVTTSSVTLSWTTSAGATSYKIQRCTGSTCTNFAQVGTDPAPPYTNSSLAANTTYRYRIVATNSAGDSPPSGIRNVKTAAPPTSAQPPPPPPPPPTDDPVVPPTTSTSSAPVVTTSSSNVAVLGNGNGGTAAGSGSSRPSLLMLGGTAGIMFAFLIALIFLVRERRKLKLESEEDEDGYWNDYRTELR